MPSKTKTAPEPVEEQAVAPELYRYEFIGPAPLTFMDLTAHGVGEVLPARDHEDGVSIVESPVAIVHHELVPADDRTLQATAELVAEMYPELAPEPETGTQEPAEEPSGPIVSPPVSTPPEQAPDAGSSTEESTP